MYYDEDAKWKCFEESGRIADYLEYRGVRCSAGSVTEGEREDADEGA